jgi:predicted metal-dependent phosphoesterase TrpH
MAVTNKGAKKTADNGRVDLHCHTTASDGMFAPAEVVHKGHAAGLSAIAITDHDTVAGVAEAAEEGERLGITVVPGIEISTYAEGADIHVLGYFTANDNELWQERLSSLRGVRGNRNVLIVEKLRSLGIAIAWSDVEGIANERRPADGTKGKSIGRPHIAEALIRKGVVATMGEAFDRYLAAGAAAYVEMPKVHPVEALCWIKEAGGAGVIAHPGLYGRDALVKELIAAGADGIEVYHPDHGAESEQRYLELAHRHGIIATGGSDYHGERNGESYHGAIGSRYASPDTIRALLDKLLQRNGTV